LAAFNPAEDSAVAAGLSVADREVDPWHSDATAMTARAN
jgi:hypothetical protein